jgi:membrane protein
VYETHETRKFLQLRLISTAFVALGAVLGVCIVSLLIINDSFLLYLGLPAWLVSVILALRWVVIAAFATLSLAVFYRYAPDRKNPHWQWVTWGSLIATILWLIGTTLFFLYARYFAHYTESYSVFAGIIVLMIWLNLTAFSILLGAEINFRLENQTRAKTTN